MNSWIYDFLEDLDAVGQRIDWYCIAMPSRAKELFCWKMESSREFHLLQDVLWQLSALATAGGAADDEHTVLLEGLQHLRALGMCRQPLTLRPQFLHLRTPQPLLTQSLHRKYMVETSAHLD